MSKVSQPYVKKNAICLKFEYVFKLKYNACMELPGKKFDQQMDRIILILLRQLQRQLGKKTKDLMSKSLVFSDDNQLEAVRYISICLDTAEEEYLKIAFSD